MTVMTVEAVVKVLCVLTVQVYTEDRSCGGYTECSGIL